MAASGAGVPDPTALQSFVEKEKGSQRVFGGGQVVDGLESALEPSPTGASALEQLKALERALNNRRSGAEDDRSETAARSRSSGPSTVR